MKSPKNPVGEFSITLHVADGRAVLDVRGEVDLCTAPELRSILDCVVERHRFVVLDLGDLDFMDASGLGVIARGAAFLAGSGGSLTIRSPPAMLLRLLAATGMTESVRIEQSASSDSHLAAQEYLAPPEEIHEVGDAAPTASPRRITAVPANADMVDSALGLVVALARATVGGADGVSVSLQRHGRLVTVAASDRTISEMDASQYATGEGPCVDASIKGLWFHAESLAHETRWPAFTPQAMGLGINSILSSPLLVAERPVGALNIYSRTSGAFAPKDQELAATFATEASVILRNAGVDVTDAQQTNRLRMALETRRIIAQAEGVIMEREGIGADAAYRLLRHFSQRSNRPFYERAQDVVASTLRTELGDETGSAEGLRG
jgi:anti-anti-sigma factor